MTGYNGPRGKDDGYWEAQSEPPSSHTNNDLTTPMADNSSEWGYPDPKGGHVAPGGPGMSGGPGPEAGAYGSDQSSEWGPGADAQDPSSGYGPHSGATPMGGYGERPGDASGEYGAGGFVPPAQIRGRVYRPGPRSPYGPGPGRGGGGGGIHWRKDRLAIVGVVAAAIVGMCAMGSYLTFRGEDTATVATTTTAAPAPPTLPAITTTAPITVAGEETTTTSATETGESATTKKPAAGATTTTAKGSSATRRSGSTSTTTRRPASKAVNGYVSKADVEAQIGHVAKTQARTITVSCPGNLKAHKGTTMKCDVTGMAKPSVATVTVTSVSGSSVHYEIRIKNA